MATAEINLAFVQKLPVHVRVRPIPWKVTSQDNSRLQEWCMRLTLQLSFVGEHF